MIATVSVQRGLPNLETLESSTAHPRKTPSANHLPTYCLGNTDVDRQLDDEHLVPNLLCFNTEQRPPTIAVRNGSKAPSPEELFTTLEYNNSHFRRVTGSAMALSDDQPSHKPPCLAGAATWGRRGGERRVGEGKREVGSLMCSCFMPPRSPW